MWKKVYETAYNVWNMPAALDVKRETYSHRVSKENYRQ